ncbi:MAG: Glu-tRNA(Gln) amidotransferase subunit GatE [Candidatus Altiarchaeia archaeon]
MTDLDYSKLGLKCGVEIHQQLDTKKLFCNCPCEIREDAPDVVIRRRLRAVAGEMGGIDPAALHEFLRGREFVYEGYTSSNCLVELDDEPPHPLNHEALSVALEVSLLLNAKPVDELQVMRKTVIDGSNTSGFQRTVLIAMDGFVEAPEGRVGILTVCLEEDAARKIKEEGSVTTYRLDRLGIPLVEIATSPDIKSPQHARIVAEKLGMILRATNKVKRGLGTIRQDLNVSIREGARVEVKGVQDLRLISKIVECEVSRQLMLIEVKNELHKRKVSEESLLVDYADLSSLFKNSTSKVIRSALDNGGVVLAAEMRGFAGLLKGRLGPELAQYARAIAGVKGIFHSDELPNYGITAGEVLEVSINLDIKEGDAFVLVAEKEAVAHAALHVVLERARTALKGVPKETRKATPEGTSEFMRPLPGSARMYPETDEPLVVIGGKYLAQVKGSLSTLPEEKLEEFVTMGLSKELAGQLVKSRWVLRFEEFVRRFPEVKPSVTATMLISMPKEVRKRFDVDIESLGEDKYAEVLSCLNEKRILRDTIPEILAELGKDPNSSVKDIINNKGFSLLSEGELGMFVDKVIKENPGKPEGMLIGRVMAEVRGRADAESVKSAIGKRLGLSR